MKLFYIVIDVLVYIAIGLAALALVIAAIHAYVKRLPKG